MTKVQSTIPVLIWRWLVYYYLCVYDIVKVRVNVLRAWHYITLMFVLYVFERMELLDNSYDLNAALVALAEKNFSFNDISDLIFKYDRTRTSANAIGKRLRKLGVPSRRGNTLHGEAEVKRVIVASLEELPESVGYRAMTGVLRRKGMHVRRNTVMKLMRTIDPDGVHYRRRRRIQRRVYQSIGPNHLWHIDGYDKLKPYGFAIHGCIDGYSRKMMWLTVGHSNNNPRIVATNFVMCVKKMKGCPLILQSDPGTENVVIGALQCVFRHNAGNYFSGLNSYRVARSVFNQRIEAWWSMLRRRQTQLWMQSLKSLANAGQFHRGNINETYCLRFCLIPLMQRELDNIIDEWNGHFVSFSRQASCPNGRPDVLHSLCENTGGIDCLQPIGMDEADWAMTECEISNRSGSVEFDDFARESFDRNGWSDEFTWDLAIENYKRLKRIL